MHELSIAEEILTTLEQARGKEGFGEIRVLRLRVGAISGIDPVALDFALQSLAPGSPLEASQIEIHVAPGSAYCSNCRVRVAIDFRMSPCPQCGHHPLEDLEGVDLVIQDLEIEPDHHLSGDRNVY